MASNNIDNIIQKCDTSLTIFLGGAGMAGNYNDEFMQALREAEICNPVYGNFSGLGFTDNGLFGLSGTEPADMGGDAASVIFYNQLDERGTTLFHGGHWWFNANRYNDTTWIRIDPETAYVVKYIMRGDYALYRLGVNRRIPEKRDKFNIIGYSWGAIIASLSALYHAFQGYEIDTLVLLAAPVNTDLLARIKSEPNIKNIIIKNLTEQGDAIYAGMSDAEIISAVPTLMSQISQDAAGHFYYSGANTAESIRRKRELVAYLVKEGLE